MNIKLNWADPDLHPLLKSSTKKCDITLYTDLVKWKDMYENVSPGKHVTGTLKIEIFYERQELYFIVCILGDLTNVTVNLCNYELSIASARPLCHPDHRFKGKTGQVSTVSSSICSVANFSHCLLPIDYNVRSPDSTTPITYP